MLRQFWTLVYNFYGLKSNRAICWQLRINQSNKKISDCRPHCVTDICVRIDDILGISWRNGMVSNRFGFIPSA